MRQVILKRRALPAQGKMLVHMGDRVERDTVLAELDYVPGSMQRVDAAGFLGIHPELLDEKMCVTVGQRVHKGDPLARNAEFGYVKEILSPIDGFIALSSKYLGFIYVRNLSQQAAENKPIIFLASEQGQSNSEFIADFLPAQEKPKEAAESRAGSAESFVPSGMEMNTDKSLLAGNGIVMAGQRLFSSTEQVAPFTCRITVFDEAKGRIEMVPMYQISQLQAHLSGFVRALPEPGACILATYGYRFQGAVGYGDEGSGVVHPLVGEKRDVDEVDIHGDLQGRIVIARGGATLGALEKLAVKQVAGLVLGSLDIDTLAEFSKQEPLQQLGHLMALPYPIVLLQGYEGTIAKEIYSDIATLAGRYALIDASTHLRAGVARPELLVPLNEEVEPRRESLLYDETVQGEEITLLAGERVVITRNPHAGQLAEIVRVGNTLEATPAGTCVVMAEVRLVGNNSGTTVFLPLANCKRIVEGDTVHD